MNFGTLPDLCIGCIAHVDLAHVNTFRVDEDSRQLRRQILVEQELHPGESPAYAPVRSKRQARANILRGKIWELGEQLFLTHSAADIPRPSVTVILVRGCKAYRSVCLAQ